MRAFTPLVGWVALAAAALVPATLASAGDRDQASARAHARPVLICATDAATRRAFTRQHGVAPTFVTARQALSVNASEPAWTTPRCMTAREHARYRAAATSYASAR